MRKLLISAAALVGTGEPATLVLAPVAAADAGTTADPPCLGRELVPGSGISAAPPAAPSGGTTQSGTVQVCLENTASPYTGTVTASGTGGPGGVTGYVVANGNSSNPGPTAGYLGAQGAIIPTSPGSSSVQVVGCGAAGYYQPGGNPSGPPGGTTSSYGSDHVILDSANPTQPSLSGQCAFANPPG